MAKVYITEYERLKRDANAHGMQIPEEPPIAEQTLDLGDTSVQSEPFNGRTTVIRVHTDAICSRAIGENPEATADSARMVAGQTEYLGVHGGHKIAVISNT